MMSVMRLVRGFWWMSAGVFVLMTGMLVSPDLLFTITDAYDPPAWVPNVLFLWWFFWLISLSWFCTSKGFRELIQKPMKQR